MHQEYRLRHKLAFWLGFAAVVVYWLSVKPTHFQRGYIEDHCTFEMSRQIMADQLRESGSPRFFTRHYMYPEGTSVAFMPQSIEQTWLGATFWNWNRDFPYTWVYFGVSLLLTYSGVGFILKKMKLAPLTAWSLSALVTVFNLPRHYTVWYHSEHLFLHWIYLGFFLDAWVWQRFYREQRWSLTLEFWRGFCLLGVLGTCGYFWGPSLVEWILIRICLLAGVSSNRKKGILTIIDGTTRSLILPTALCILLFIIDLKWFLPLLKEARKLGIVPQGLIYHAPIFMVIRPLWFDWIMRGIETLIPLLKGVWWPFQAPETKVTIGWVYWIPAILGIRAASQKKTLGILTPFLILLGIAIWYLGIKPHWVPILLQMMIPFMKFFRVACRWGLFLPPIVGILIALTWPELSLWTKSVVQKESQKWKILFVLFLVSSIIEIGWLLKPANMMPPLSTSTLRFLEDIRKLPGTAVLDLPFCVLGGNEVCSHQCPAFPLSMAGACFRQWHDKDVYGIYESRLVSSQCANYDQPPYQSWMGAWGGQRCFTDSEWKNFCSYLDQHSELSAVLIYPDVWFGASTPECQRKILKYLGKPLDETTFSVDWLPSEPPGKITRVLRFAPQCRASSP